MISIIVPVYNGEKYLARCLDSIISQTYKDIQVILINDGSSDGTAKICDDFAIKDNRIVVVHKENTGVADTRNVGLNLATGEYTGFVDADDYIEPDMYEKLIEAALDNDADICCCGYYEESEDGKNQYKHSCEADAIIYEKPDDTYAALFCHDGKLGDGNWNKIFRTSILKHVRFKKYVVGEDVEFQCMAIHNSSRTVCISDALYHYIHNPNNATSSLFRPQSMDIIKVVDSLIIFIENEHPMVVKQMYAYHLMWYMATVQVMYWSKDTRPYKKEKDQLREVIVNNMDRYGNNPYVYKLDRIFMKAFVWRCFRPVYSLFCLYRKLK